LIKQQPLMGVVPAASIKYSDHFLHFIRNCTRRTEGAPLLAPGPVGNFDNTGVVMNHHQKARILKKHPDGWRRL
jgi:hypothetical protein